MERRGSALLGKCDRAAYTELFTPEGRSIILPTACKTWGCVICRRKLLSLFKARVEIGVSHLGRCAFMTLTYQADSARLRDAGCVQRDWQALWRRLKRRGHRWKWLKVTELTKQRIPHHHVVLGTIDNGKEIRCHGTTIRRGKETSRYLDRLPSCDCVAHIFAREWMATTSDSYMCFGTAVSDAAGAAAYMGKYMQKDFLRPDRTGKERRFSTSRDWPGGKRLRLAVTLEGGWSHIKQWPAGSFSSTDEINPREQDLLERVGDDITVAIALRNSKRAARARFGQLLNNNKGP